MRRGISMMVLLTFIGGNAAAWAGDIEDGFTAIGRKDYTTALKKFRIGVANNDSYAQVGLGTMYENGDGVVQDYVEAVKWYQLSARQGNAVGQFDTGHMFYSGKGVNQDYAQAAMWFQQAARQGFATAQRNLAIMYFLGQGVAEDYVLAHMWSNVAAASGDAASAGIRDKVANLMTPQQIAEAQKMARDCQAQNFKGCN